VEAREACEIYTLRVKSDYCAPPNPEHRIAMGALRRRDWTGSPAWSGEQRARGFAIADVAEYLSGGLSQVLEGQETDGSMT
jgi:hypothetical protein